MIKTKLIIISLSLFCLLRAFASDEESIKQALISYKTGGYNDTLTALTKISDQSKLAATKYYWQGLCLNRLQNYSDAAKAFKRAEELGHKVDDIYYEHGQALYAMNELEGAMKQFEASYKNKYKEANSLYYQANIAHTLENYSKAFELYTKMIKEGYDENGLNQIARYQLALVMLDKSESKEDPKKWTEKYILPLLKQALDINTQSEVASDIQTKINDLQDKYDLDPYKMRNGTHISPKNYTLTLAQKVTYDNNVTLANDLPTTRSTQDESFVLDTRVEAEYRFIFAKRVIIKPFISSTLTRYENRKNSSVFSNDSYTVAPQLKSSYEHTLFKSPASFLFDLQYNYTARDRDKNKSRIFFGRAYTISVGEKFKTFFTLPTTFKYKKKEYTSYTPNSNNSTTSYSLMQLFPLSAQNMLLVLANLDQSRVEDDAQSTDSTLIRLDFIRSSFIDDRFTLDIGFGYTSTDTLAQKATRGVEKSYNPSVKLSDEISKNLNLSISYDYTKNSSLDKESYTYTKHVTAFELEYSF